MSKFNSKLAGNTKLCFFAIFAEFGNAESYRFVLDFLSLSTFQKNYNNFKSTVNTSTSSSIQLQNIPGNIRRYSFQTQQPNSGIYFFKKNFSQVWNVRSQRQTLPWMFIYFKR